MESDLPLQGAWHPDKTPYNIAIWKFDEHGLQSCGPSCPYRNPKATIHEWPVVGFRNPWDKIKARFLGYVCGMYEPTQDLVTPSHLWVQIDNELTFRSWAFGRKAHEDVMQEASKDSLFKIDGVRPVVAKLCEQISDFPEAEIERIVTVPAEYRCRTLSARIEQYLQQTRWTAARIRKGLDTVFRT
jgi:hypothetical protein